MSRPTPGTSRQPSNERDSRATSSPARTAFGSPTSLTTPGQPHRPTVSSSAPTASRASNPARVHHPRPVRDLRPHDARPCRYARRPNSSPKPSNTVLRPIDGPAFERDVYALLPPGGRRPLAETTLAALSDAARELQAPRPGSAITGRIALSTATAKPCAQLGAAEQVGVPQADRRIPLTGRPPLPLRYRTRAPGSLPVASLVWTSWKRRRRDRADSRSVRAMRKPATSQSGRPDIVQWRSRLDVGGDARS